MKAYLIDPFKRDISVVEYTGNYKNIYEHIEAQTFDLVRINVEGDCIYLDDEGYYAEPKALFTVRGYQNPLVNKGLVLGTDEEGESVEPKITLEQLRELIEYPDEATGPGIRINGERVTQDFHLKRTAE